MAFDNVCFCRASLLQSAMRHTAATMSATAITNAATAAMAMQNPYESSGNCSTVLASSVDDTRASESKTSLGMLLLQNTRTVFSLKDKNLL
jgi:hypothetical protein